MLEKRINGQNPQVPLAKAPQLCPTLQLLLYCARRLVLVGEVKLCREACFKHLIEINSMEKFNAAPRSHVSSRWSPQPLYSLASPRAIMLPVDWALGSDSHSEIPPPYLDATRANRALKNAAMFRESAGNQGETRPNSREAVIEAWTRNKGN